MGWWSEDIMGGDTPLDIKSFIYDALDIKQYPDDNYDKKVIIPSDVFDYDKIVKYVNDRDSDNYWLTGDTGNIFHQVLGVMMMESGASISDKLKAKMTLAAVEDEWGFGYTRGEFSEEGDEDRAKKMNQFIDTLINYDETPTKITSKGLFETIAKGIEAEKPKNWTDMQLIYCVSEVAATLGYTPTSDKMKEFNEATVNWIKENS